MTKGFLSSKIPVNTKEELIFGLPAFGHLGSLVIRYLQLACQKTYNAVFVIVNLRNPFKGGTKTGNGEGGVKWYVGERGRDGVYIATLGGLYSYHP